MTKAPRPRGCLLWGLKIFGGVLMLLVIVVIVGVIYQSRASAADRKQYAPPGDLVTVNGRQMHIHCQGQRSPTVILDAGQGGWSIMWSDIMSQVSNTTQVCAYDRFGYGWSDGAVDARTPQNIANDLADLLEAGAIVKPYIMVGFSYAGLSTRIFAAQHPDDVVGMVLIDPATEFDSEFMDETLKNQQQATVSIFQTFGLAARVGLVRLLNPREIAPYAPFIAQNPVQPDVYYSFISEPDWWQTSTKEFVNHLNAETHEYVRIHGEIPDIPITIIGAKTVPDGQPGTETFNKIRATRLEELANRSSQGHFILVENSSHEVPRDRPDVVIAAIQRIVEETRN